MALSVNPGGVPVTKQYLQLEARVSESGIEPTPERVAQLLEAMSRVRIGVVGDVIADVYVAGTPDRLSREAPVIVVRWEREELIPGGAANAVTNLAALGARVSLFGSVGDDDTGSRLITGLGARGVDTRGIVAALGTTTVTKTRVMVGDEGRTPQQVLRIDRDREGREPGESAEVAARLGAALDQLDALIVSDYGYGTVDEGVLTAIASPSRPRVVSVDSRFQLGACAGATLVTPNHTEAAAVLGRPVSTDDEAISASAELLDRLGAQIVILTRGNRGMVVHARDDDAVLLAASGPPAEVTDVSGAGDTVIAVATLALAAGASPVEAAALSNDAAAVVVTRLGAATCSPRELRAIASRSR